MLHLLATLLHSSILAPPLFSYVSQRMIKNCFERKTFSRKYSKNLQRKKAKQKTADLKLKRHNNVRSPTRAPESQQVALRPKLAFSFLLRRIFFRCATMYVHHTTTTTTTATSSFDTHHCSSKREPVIKVATWNLVITSLQFSRSPLCLPQLPAESATHFISILSLRVHGPPLPAHSVEQVISQRAESHRATFLSAFWSLFPSSIPS